MAKQKTSEHQKALYKIYKTSQTWLKNRIARIERHLKKHPEDSCAKKALKECLDSPKYKHRKVKA